MNVLKQKLIQFAIAILIGITRNVLKRFYDVIKPIIVELFNADMSNEDKSKEALKRAKLKFKELGIKIKDNWINLLKEIIILEVKSNKSIF